MKIRYLFFLLISCGTPPTTPCPSPDYSVGSIGVALGAGAPTWLLSSDFPTNLERVTQAALDLGHGQIQDLADQTAYFHHGILSDGLGDLAYSYQWPGCVEISTGFEDVERPSTHQLVSWEPTCLAETGYIHEILHVLIGDPNHQDPRWSQLPTLMHCDLYQ